MSPKVRSSKLDATRALREQRFAEQVDVDPTVEARRREQRMLDGLGTAREDFEWLAAREGWTLLGFSSLADWWGQRVQPVIDGLSLKPAPALAKRVVEIIKAEEAALPARQRRTARELTALVGSEWIARGRVQDRPARRSSAGSDLDGPDPADIPDALRESIKDTAHRVAAGSEWSCEHCNGKLTGPEWEGGRRRCISCDKGGHHRALTLDERLTSDNDFTTDCRECLRLARIAAETAAGAVTPVEPAGAAVVVVGGSEPVTTSLGLGSSTDLASPGPVEDTQKLDEEETPPALTSSHPSDSPAAVTDDTVSQVVLQQSGAISPTDHGSPEVPAVATASESAVLPRTAPDDGGVGLPAPSSSGITSDIEEVPWRADTDHRPAAAGVSPVGREAPERPPLSVEPVLEDGGPAPALPSSSSDPEDLPDELAPSAGRPETIVAAYRDFADLLDEVIDHDVLAPLITDAEMAELHALADRIAFHVGAIERWRTP